MLTRCLKAFAWTATCYGLSVVVAIEFLAGPHARIAVLAGLDPAGSPVTATAVMAAVIMAGTYGLLFAGSAPFLVTGIGLSAASAALRRHRRPVLQDARTLLACAALLAAWVALYGASPFWLAWDGLILAGMVGSAWNLIARLPRRENRHV